MAECKYEYKDKEYTLEELKEVLSLDESLLDKYKSNESPLNEGRFTGDLNKELDQLEALYNQIVSRVHNAYNLSRPKTKEEAAHRELDKKEGKKTHDIILEELKEDIDKLNDVDKRKTIVKFVAWAENTLSAIEDHLDKIIDGGKMNHEMVLRIKNKNAIYDLLDDVLASTQGYEGSQKIKDAIVKKVKNLNSVKRSIDAKLLDVERKQYAEIMTENSNQHLVEWRNKFSKIYDAINPQEPKNEWIEKKMVENSKEIKDKAYQVYLKQAEESLSDLNSVMSRFVTEKNLNSGEIQVASKMLDAADLKTFRFAKDKAVRMKSHYDAFAKGKSDVNRENLYKKFVEQTEEGTYLHSEYSIQFKKDKRAMELENSDPDKLQEKYGDVVVDNTTKLYNLNGKTYMLKAPRGGKYLKINGDHVSYKIKGELHHKSLVEMIGQAQIKAWRAENTMEIVKDGVPMIVPIEKYLNKEYAKLSQEELITLAEFKSFISEANTLTGSNESLIETDGGNNWYRLPGVTRTSISRILAGDLKNAAFDKVTDAFKRKKDEIEIGDTGSRDKNTIKVLADINNKEKMTVPTGHRAKLSPKEQSLDLHTILLLNLQHAKNYEQKKELESQILVMADIMSNRFVPKHRGVGKKQEIHSFSNLKDMKVYSSKNDLPNDVKKLLDLAENRIYGIKTKDAGEVAGMNINKATGTALKYAGSVSLIRNFTNSFINATTGTMNNLIEAVGGETYSIKDWKQAGVKYWKDAKGIIDDTGSQVTSSRTNMFNDLFNVMGSAKALNSNFEDNTRIKALMKGHALRPIANAGEHMMQSKVMYAVMNSIKITDAQGRYLDSEGNIVKDKKDAASIDDVISFNTERGGVKTEIPSFVKGTTFSPGASHDQILLETRNLIKKKIIDLHGNYDTELQSAAQREWWGKAIFFLKKWMESTTLRRWRGLPTVLKNSEELREVDKFYSEDLKSYQEGFYVTSARFIWNTLVPAIKTFNVELIKSDLSKMTTHEKANVKRMMIEFSAIALTMLGYMAMGGFDDDPDEDTLMARYFLRREMSELTFYANPAEAIKIIKSPSAAINFTDRITKVIGQAFSPTEEYKTGKNKGRNKLWVKTLKALPVTAQSEKDFEASLRFLQVME